MKSLQIVIALFNHKERMKIVQVFLLAVASTGICAGQTNLPAWVQSANGKQTNYIAEALRGTLITNATERVFLQEVLRNDKDGQLARSLGYVGTVAYHEFGKVQYPGKKAEPMYADSGFSQVQFQRMHLVFTADDTGHDSRILVLARFSGWPGMNNTCVVIVSKEFTVLDWRLHEQDDMFDSAAFDTTHQRLVVTCRRRSGGKVDYDYDLRDNKITMLSEEGRTTRSSQLAP